MSNNILDLNVDTVDDIKDHPPGKYKGVVTGYKVDKNTNDKQFIVVEFKAQEALEDQDLTGVEMNRTLRGERLFLTDSAVKYTKSALARISKPTGSFADWFETLVGQEVVFELKTEEVEKNGSIRQYTNVVSARAA